MRSFVLVGMHVGDAGASALAAALGRGALPDLRSLVLSRTAITDAGLVALAPALRRLPALEMLFLCNNLFGDEGIAALVPPPPPTGALPPPARGLTKLKSLGLARTQISDVGCAALVSALDNGALPAVETVGLLWEIPASGAAKRDVLQAVARAMASRRRGLNHLLVRRQVFQSLVALGIVALAAFVAALYTYLTPWTSQPLALATSVVALSTAVVALAT